MKSFFKWHFLGALRIEVSLPFFKGKGLALNQPLLLSGLYE